MKYKLENKWLASVAATMWLIAFMALGSGCSSTKGVRVLKDGSTLAITNHRLLWNAEGVDFSVTDTNGFKVGLKIQKSNPDAESLGAIAEGVARGLK